MGGADRCGLDLLKHYKRQGYRCVVIATRHSDKNHTKRHCFAEWADEIYTVKSVAHTISVEQPTITIVNNSHEAYKELEVIKSICPKSFLGCLFHMILPGAWNFEEDIKRAGNAVDGVFTVSDKLRDQLVEKGVKQRLVHTLHWFGFETGTEVMTVPRRGNIICPMRLHSQKRPEFLAEIALELYCMGEEATFTILGDGALQGKVQKQFEDAGLADWLHFEGSIDFFDMPAYYEDAAALCVPSIDEGIPLAYFEAMQCGVPLAVSNVGAVAELVPPEYMVNLFSDDEAGCYARLIAKHLKGRSKDTIAQARETIETCFSSEVWQAKVSNLI